MIRENCLHTQFLDPLKVSSVSDSKTTLPYLTRFFKYYSDDPHLNLFHYEWISSELSDLGADSVKI